MEQQFIRVSKEFSFDMAHALLAYDGHCKNIHGHTYHLTITLIGKTIEDKADPKLGMVIDFGDLKNIVQQNIISKFDHSLVINERAPYSSLNTLSSELERIIMVPFQPSCENLILHFVEILKNIFINGIQLFSVKLQETPSSFAEWYATDQMMINKNS